MGWKNKSRRTEERTGLTNKSVRKIKSGGTMGGRNKVEVKGRDELRSNKLPLTHIMQPD